MGMCLRRKPSNNGMHPTPHHGASHVRCTGARVMPGVRCFQVLSLMEYSFHKNKLPKGFSYPIKRSVLDEFLISAHLKQLVSVTYSFYNRSDDVITRVSFSGESHRGWSGVGQSSITIQAVPSEQRKEVEGLMVGEVLPDMCLWLRNAEAEGNAWRAKSRHLVFRYVDGGISRSEL